MSGSTEGGGRVEGRARATSGLRAIREREEPWGPFTAYVHPEWRDEFPWLVQGLTGRAAHEEARRLESARDGAFERALAVAAGIRRVVRVSQVHGAAVTLVHGNAEPRSSDRADALVTGQPGIGLAVLVADCVPAFVLDPVRRAIAVVHAGWRGTAAGVLEATISCLRSVFGSQAADLRVHFGPGICGACYEVGAEVFDALGLPAPGPKGFVDLAEILAQRADGRGVRTAQMTRSAYCTRCQEALFYSYRREGPRAGRMAGLIALR